MENIILFDNETREHLLPFTYTRPVCEIRVGILTIREKWERWLKGNASYITQDYLSEKYDITIAEKNYIVNGSVLPSDELMDIINSMKNNVALLKNGELIVAKLDKAQFSLLMDDDEIEELDGYEIGDMPLLKIDHLWDIFKINDAAIRSDFDLLTKGRTSQKLSDNNLVIGTGDIFVEEGASVEGAILNTKTGPIYIGKDAEIMEGSAIRGPFALCDGATLKLNAKVYGPTTIGPFCKVGGEVKNSVIFGYSNKSHDGYLGNSVIGEWCNLGADTNNSNLKNNYGDVKVWNYATEQMENSGEQFCGLFLGDHSNCGINTMFNTGTVVGIATNVFGTSFPPKFVPSFSWGGAAGFSDYKTEKVFETAERMMEHRGMELSTMDRVILLKVAEETAKFRS